ncbi:MAG: hypothetical protein ACFFKA_13120 [Candidatus Thorarchaeota archaeon]
MSGLFIEFNRDLRGFWYFKINEEKIYFYEPDKLMKFLVVMLKKVHYWCDVKNQDFNDLLVKAFTQHNQEYPKFRNLMGYIKMDREKSINTLENL